MDAAAEPDAPEGPLLVDDRPIARWYRAWTALDRSEQVAVVLDAVVLVAATVFVIAQLAPKLLIADTTPAGGDMGAHVWGPAYLRDQLLPDFRLAGWAPDWYAGFPAYQFYMVVPALLVVALDAGWSGWAALVPGAVALGLFAVSLLDRRRVVRRAAFVGAVVVAVLGIGLPYGVAFKWVTVVGLVSLPVICYVAARLADLPFPGPSLLSIGAVVFLFNRQPVEGSTGNIIGGNVASTLAGEFSFSLSFGFCVLYLGFLLRGLRTGGYRATCAVLLGLTALCHIIPAIYAGVATLIAFVVSLPMTRQKLRWFLPIAPVAVAITAFWTGPFLLRRAYLNDMGWEKLPTANQDVGDYLAPRPIQWIIALALVGLVVSALLRVRLGVFLALCAVVSAVAFVVAPQGRFWNARILPFYLLCLCLLGALAVGELARAIAALTTRRPSRRVHAVSFAAPVGAALAAWVVVGLPLGVLPGSARSAEGATEWGPLSVSSADRNVVRDWARWNYSGYERKAAFPEYAGLVEMMQGVADDPTLGCGRAMWEYENDRLNTYGTPMAPMLLPFWTDGCIGSMEGLYFEASSTTPYHFLNQRALSAICSCAQRDLPYGPGFDIDLGVAQLQEMGVRYYLAFSDTAVRAAAAHPALSEIASSGPWHAYLVADSDLVEPLAYEPVVLDGLEPGMSWVGPASKWFEDPTRWDVPLAADGPDEWQRVDVCTAPEVPKADGTVDSDEPTWKRMDVCTLQPEREALAPITVSAIDASDDGISFDVSDVGVPVVVKVSYFPNWQVDGAEGPYRITPNLMVVIPTDTHVELSYGWTGVDIGSYALSFAGILGAVGLARLPRRDPEGRVWLDGPDIAVLGPTDVEDGAEDELTGDDAGEPDDDDERWDPESDLTDDDW